MLSTASIIVMLFNFSTLSTKVMCSGRISSICLSVNALSINRASFTSSLVAPSGSKLSNKIDSFESSHHYTLENVRITCDSQKHWPYGRWLCWRYKLLRPEMVPCVWALVLLWSSMWVFRRSLALPAWSTLHRTSLLRLLSRSKAIWSDTIYIVFNFFTYVVFIV